MRNRSTGSAILVYLLATTGCDTPPGPVRHTPTAKLQGEFAQRARRADALGLTPTAVHSVRPASRGDLLRAFPGDEEPAVTAEDAELTLDKAWFAEYETKYADDVEEQWDDGETSWIVFQPLDSTSIRFIAVDETVKFYNEQGREFENGANLYISNRFSARLFDRIVITAEPEFSFVQREDVPNEDEAINLRFQELATSTRLGPLQLTVGRQPMWWGPGRHGSLLLSNNARPFDLIKLSTAGPILLPWYFAYLGLIHSEIFVTRLESARSGEFFPGRPEKAQGVPRPYLGGMRLTSRVFPWLEVGASRTAQFGGKGRGVNGRTIWEVITADTENDLDDPGNQLASIDARIVVPWKPQPFEIYGEYGGEDEAGGFFSREAYLAGVYLPRIGSSHNFELTVEWADTSVDGHAGTWYRNRNYPHGYTFHDRIIGHHVGTDGRDIFAELRMHPPVCEDRDVTLVLSYDYEEHFRLDPVVERLHQFRAAVEVGVWRDVKMSVFYGYDVWENFRQVRGRGEEGNAVGVGAAWEF